MRLVGVQAKKTLAGYSAFHANITYPRTWPKNNDKVLQAIEQDVENFIENDWLLSNVAPHKELNGRDCELFALFKNHPILCGIMAFNINLGMQEAGLNLINAWGTGIFLAYLYDAIAREEIAQAARWPDMDKLIEMHTEERLFFGGRPKTNDDAYKKLCLAMGVSPEAFAAPEMRSRNVPLSKHGPRGLEEQSIISKVYRNRYCGRGQMDLSTSNIERVLHDLAGKKGIVHSASQSGSAILQKKWRQTSRLSPLQLLAALRERLVDEEPSLVFNYFGMHQRGIELLRQLRTSIHDKFVQYFGPEYIENGSQLCMLVPSLLHVAVMSARAAAPASAVGSSCGQAMCWRTSRRRRATSACGS